jgi:O-antigen/teichoic acid export membrane protein
VKEENGILDDRATAIRWLGKGTWAIMDQGFFAVSNFIMTVFLARWLAEADFGAFAVAFTLFLLLAMVHGALLTEPMLVFGPKDHAHCQPQYLGALIYGHCLIALPLGALLAGGGAVAWWLGHAAFAEALFAYAWAQSFILFLWLMRKACYLRLRPRPAAMAGLVYLVLMTAGLMALHSTAWFSITMAMVVMAFSSLVSGLALAWWVGLSRPMVEGRSIFKSVARIHWDYGRWSMATGALSFFPGKIYYLIIPLMGGMEASGALRALKNLIHPFLMAKTALSKLLLPKLVKSHGTSAFTQVVRLAMVVFLSGPVLYWICLGILHKPLISLIYGGRFIEYSSLLWILGLIPIISAPHMVLSSMIRAYKRPDILFYATVVETIAAATLGIALTYWIGLMGVAIALCITAAIKGLVLAWQWRRLVGAEARPQHEPEPVPIPMEVAHGTP